MHHARRTREPIRSCPCHRDFFWRGVFVCHAWRDAQVDDIGTGPDAQKSFAALHAMEEMVGSIGFKTEDANDSLGFFLIVGWECDVEVRGCG